MKRLMVGVLTTAWLSATALVHAQSDWSAQDYDLYPGDFNGDGYTDLLYISREASRPSGIVLSDGTGLNTSLQSWGNAYLGIPWSDGSYNVIVADINGDGKADVLLQRKTPGDNYLLLTEYGGLRAISQTIPNDAAGLSWSADQHQIIAGDFNGDGKADLYFQPIDAKGLSAVVLADPNGQFTAKAPHQSWKDGYAGLKWAANEAQVYTGDFDGNGRSDLLVQAYPIPGTGPGTTQPAKFEPNMNGVLLARNGKRLFAVEGLQAWGRHGFDAEWSPLDSVVVVADFNADHRSDVYLQAATAGNASYMLHGHAPGPIFASGTVLKSGAPADAYRILPGRFTAEKGDGLYFQSLSPKQTNFVAQVHGGALTVTQADASLAAPTGWATLAPPLGRAAQAVLAVTSAGRTPGQFAVSAMGAATYQIPIWTPPGARGIEPHLAFLYSSGSQDGMMGPGWNLNGLSSITRCNKTYADNGGAPAAVRLTTADDFCLDGNRLRLTGGTYGVAGSTYQTQVSTFSNVTANGAAGSGPSYFVVQGKDGLYYEYGNTTDSKVYANGGTTPYAWMLNKVHDRETSADNLTVTYSTTSGSVQPVSIKYTQTPSTNGTTYPYTVNFTYQNRLKNLSKYVAGENIKQTQVLAKIDVQSSGVSVRQYAVTYATAPTTQRDRVSSIQECAGSAGSDCLRPTTVTYQNGTAGVSAASTALPFPAGLGGTAYWDFNGDGKPDLLYTNAGTATVMLSTASGYGPAISTGVTAALAYGDVLGSGKDGIVADNAGALWYYSYNGTAFVGTSLGMSTPTASSFKLVDIEGNGHPDLVTMQVLELIVYRNTSAGATPSFSPTLIGAYTITSPGGALRGTPGIFANSDSLRAYDFDGDGRKDIALRIRFDCGTQQEPDVCTHETELLSAGTTFVAGQTFAFSGSLTPVAAFTNWNSDACTDLILGDPSITTSVYVSPCTGGAPIEIDTPLSLKVVGTMDWNGDGQSDLVVANGSTLGIYPSTGIGIGALIATTIPYLTGTGYTITDINGDGLEEIVTSTGTSGAYFAHNGAGIPADLATTISDGWLISASPTYESIAQDNYTKGAAAVFPESDIALPIYVVTQATQSNGIGGTFNNTFWYYGARVHRQGRGFEGFATTRSLDSRNSIYQYVYYNQAFPYTTTVSRRDTVQPDNVTVISTTLNTFSSEDPAGAVCTTSSPRCFPFLKRALTTSYEITAAHPLIQTSDSNFTYDVYGNVLTASSATTDNDTASPNSTKVWTSLVTSTYGSNSTATWCLDKPTRTTTQNSITGQTAQTRTVDHVVDTTHCRFSSETLEPTSTTLKAVTNYGYDTCGNVNSVGIVGLDKSGAAMPTRTTTSNYGTRCTFPESVKNALNQTSNIAYNYSYGVKASSTDPNNISSSWLYDNFGRKTSESRPDSTSTTWVYEDCISAACWTITDNLRLRVTETQNDSAGAYVTSALHHYDGLERLRYDSRYRVLGTLTWNKTTLDALGRKVDTYLPYSAASNGYHHVSYDLLDRPLSDKLYNSSGVLDRTTSLAYAGLKTTITDARGNSTSKWTDVAGKLRRIIDPAPGGTTNYTYDPFGNLTQIMDAKTPTGAVTSYSYNIRGFKTGSTDPDTGTSIFTPNSLNELVTQQDAKAQLTSFGYDLLGRMTSRLEPESATATTWVYGTSAALHEIGRLKSLAKPDGYQESYTFDSLGRPATRTITEDTTYNVSYTYNTIGEINTVTYPASTGTAFVLKYLYSYGALQQVKDNAAGTVFWSLSAANDSSLPTTEVLGSGITVGSTYTPWTNDLVTRKEGTSSVPNSLQDLAYQWDDNGNLQQRQDMKQSLTEVFVHDTLNRLSTSTLNGTQNLSVGYDETGNITSKSDVGSFDYATAQGACNYTGLTSQPHAVRNAGGAVYCYDKNGNVTSRQGGALIWTSYNLPSSIVSGGNSTTFNYNANHQRWKQDANYAGTHEVTYYVGGVLEKVTKGSGPTEYRHLIPAGSGSVILTRRSDLTNSTYYITSDHLGSGDLILSSTGTVLAHESFTPFGARRGSNWQGLPSTADNTTFSNTTRRGFTGHEMLDSVNLIHMSGRVYDPTIGRFLSADPLIQTIALSQAINPFSYVMNQPLTLTDPSGLSWLSKAFNGIGHFFSKYWRVIVAIVVSVISCGALTPLCVTFAGSAILGGALAGAISGAIAGAITGGWKGALVGAVSGAMFGGIHAAFGSTWNAERVALSGVAGGISSEVSGGSFLKGAEMGFGIAALQWGASAMRESMVEQSKLDPRNASGVSDGANGDHFKLAGARWWQNVKEFSEKTWAKVWQPFGGVQGGGGMLFGRFVYPPGGAIDHLLEAFAGPHDFLGSFQYAENGDLASFWQVGVGNILGNIVGAVTIVPAAAFVGASAAPEVAYVKQH